MFNNSSNGAGTNQVQEKLVNHLRAKIEKEQQITSEIKTLEELYQNLLEQSEIQEVTQQLEASNEEKEQNPGELMSAVDEEEVKNFEETKEMQLWKASLSETMKQRFQGFQLTKEFLRLEKEKKKRMELDS